MSQSIRLKAGREKSVLRRHPWIFSGAIHESREASVGPGWTEVLDCNGKRLGFGIHSPKSQIRIRMWSVGGADAEFEPLFRERIAAARAMRSSLLSESNACRMINSEGDFMPGLILDQYDSTLVLQILTEGCEPYRDFICGVLREVFKPRVLFEKSVGRSEESLPDRVGVVFGQDDFSPVIRVAEDGREFLVDVASGHKTGSYLDQRGNISALRDIFRREFGGMKRARVLDAFCYSGAFGCGVAELFDKIIFVDSSREALALAQKNFAGPDGPRGEYICTDVFQFLRQPLDLFDAVVLDPPPFARRKSETDGACRGYKDIQRLAMQNIRPGGFLAAFSCSHHIDADLFQKVLFAAAIDAGRRCQIVHRFGHPPDHPVSIDHPEGEYLKGVLLRVC